MKIYFFLILLCMGGIACTTGGKGIPSSMPLATKVISSSLHCRPASNDWTVTLIDSFDMLELMASKIDAHLVGTSPKKIPVVDFNDFYVIAVEMGRQPTAGFGIDAKKVTAYIENRAAIIRIFWHRPSSNAQVAQILTSPCVLILLARGAYDRILVKDQEDQIIGQVSVTTEK